MRIVIDACRSQLSMSENSNRRASIGVPMSGNSNPRASIGVPTSRNTHHRSTATVPVGRSSCCRSTEITHKKRKYSSTSVDEYSFYFPLNLFIALLHPSRQKVSMNFVVTSRRSGIWSSSSCGKCPSTQST